MKRIGLLKVGFFLRFIAKAHVSFKKYIPPPLPYFKVNIYPFPLPHFASIFFAYLWSFRWPNYIVTLPRYFSFRLPHLNISTGSPSDKLDKNSDRMWLIKNFRKRRGHTFFEWNKCLWFIGWNLYLMWNPVNCRHNVRHIRTIPFLLPPEWDGWSLNSHHIFINYIKFPLLRPN